ncbi:MAG: gliding motility lipoprotein GldD [Bacteroidia bacterium]|nr:gliding motility lipoprotein GldD [Bacteroidia bacterium]
MITQSFKPVIVFLLIILSIVTLTSCGEDEDAIYIPKPKAYPRVAFPEKQYRHYDSLCPYSFDIPIYAKIVRDKHHGADLCWINVDYTPFNAQLHLSYKTVNHNLDTLLEECRDFVVKHQVKSTGIDETVIIRDSSRVFGLVYDISGNTASNLQFYITDSTHHFMRGALYFNTVPNIDSTKIIIDFLRKDVIQMLKTFEWKNNLKEDK